MSSSVSRSLHLTRRPRLILLAMAVVMLVLAVWSGLLRLGWQLPSFAPTLPSAHGPLMIAGFLGTLISLERASAIDERWTYIAPALTGLGSAALITLPQTVAGPLLISAGSAMAALLLLQMVRKHVALFAVAIALGSLAWFLGNVLWLGGMPLYRVVYWWAAYLVLTIMGERLELSRVRRSPRRARWFFSLSVALYVIGLAFLLLRFDVGVRISSAGLLALALWFWRFDVALRTVRLQGVSRYIAVCLLSGTGWLAVSGVLGLYFGTQSAGPYYDAALHTLFVGFVFAMIFGHAPIILPALAHIPVPYYPSFYLHLLLLHVSLVLRITGDLTLEPSLRRWGGLLNAFALLLFVVNIAVAVGGARRVAATGRNVKHA